MIGKISKWVSGRGFGFIQRDDGGPDIFVHWRALSDRSRDCLSVGTRVSFEIGADASSGKPRAINVTALTGNTALPRPSPREAAQAHFRD